MNKNIAYLVLAIVIIAGIVYIFSQSYATPITKSNISTSSNNSALLLPSGYVPAYIGLADPSFVPNGTTALNLSFSSLNVSVEENNTTKNITVNAKGNVNLLNLTNQSKIIGITGLPNVSIVKRIAINVNNITITINNKTYTVNVPANQIIATVEQRVNGSSNILVDILPSVITIYSNNSTSFALMPSAHGIIVKAHAKEHVNMHIPINNTEVDEFRQEEGNISILSASLIERNNQTSFSVDVKNTGKINVSIKDILLFGDFNFTMVIHPIPLSPEMATMPFGSNSFVNNSFMHNITSNISMVENTTKKFFNTSSPFTSNITKIPVNIANRMSNLVNNTEIDNMIEELKDALSHMPKNFTNMSNLTFNISPQIKIKLPVGFVKMALKRLENIKDVEHFRVVNFLVTKNGTLVLPFSMNGAELEDIGDIDELNLEGFVLAPNESHVFTYNGLINVGFGYATPITNNNYKVVVHGTRDSFATVNVTAS